MRSNGRSNVELIIKHNYNEHNEGTSISLQSYLKRVKVLIIIYLSRNL